MKLVQEKVLNCVILEMGRVCKTKGKRKCVEAL